jgi:hypothetical protein
MATATQNAPSFEQKIKGQIEDARATLERGQTAAKAKRTETEAAAIATLTSARQNIERKLQDLKGTHQSYVARAKSEIETDTATFKASVDTFTAKFKGGQKSPEARS